jgi:hypothetical protein
MATNFRIFLHRNSDSLHLNLIGEFDVTSVQELVNTLRANCNGASRVFIHTNCLEAVDPFACNVISSQLHAIKSQFKRIEFTGQHSEKMAL